jgi:antitoxin component YwqK of YwqJK toxin-antitoxin module
MGWWDRLTGRELPVRDRAPDGEAPGATQHGLKKGVWIEKGEGDFDGGLLECTYRDGVRQGPYRFWKGHLAERGALVAGERDGVVERFAQDGRRLAAAGYRAGKLHGPVHAWKADGTLAYEREYRDGERWAGNFDFTGPDGVLYWRQRYAGGKPIGAWEENDGGGRAKVRWTYDEGGVLHGPWSIHHESRIVWAKEGNRIEGGEPKLVGEYRRGARIGVWRWLRTDGSMAAECDLAGDGVWRAGGVVISPTADDDEDLGRWVALAESWAQLVSPGGSWSPVEKTVDAWPAGPEAPVTWLLARIAGHGDLLPLHSVSALDWLGPFLTEGDPRAELVDAVSTDHGSWDETCVAQIVKRAGKMRALSLVEVDLEPGVESLFPPGAAWSRLEKLTLHECGPIAKTVRLLAKATWTGALRWLRLSDGAIAGKDAAALLGSPHLGALRELHLGPIASGQTFPRALATSSILDHLEELELEVNGALDPVLAALGGRPTPLLRSLELCGELLKKPELLLELVDVDLHPALVSLTLDGVEAPEAIAGEIAKRRPSLRLYGF